MRKSCKIYLLLSSIVCHEVGFSAGINSYPSSLHSLTHCPAELWVPNQGDRFLFFPEANAVFWNSLYLPRGFLWIKATALLVILSLASVPDITLKVIDTQISSIMIPDQQKPGTKEGNNIPNSDMQSEFLKCKGLHICYNANAGR